TSTASCMTGRSDLLPMMMPTWILFSVLIYVFLTLSPSISPALYGHWRWPLLCLGARYTHAPSCGKASYISCRKGVHIPHPIPTPLPHLRTWPGLRIHPHPIG